MIREPKHELVVRLRAAIDHLSTTALQFVDDPTTRGVALLQVNEMVETLCLMFKSASQQYVNFKDESAELEIPTRQEWIEFYFQIHEVFADQPNLLGFANPRKPDFDTLSFWSNTGRYTECIYQMHYLTPVATFEDHAYFKRDPRFSMEIYRNAAIWCQSVLQQVMEQNHAMLDDTAISALNYLYDPDNRSELENYIYTTGHPFFPFHTMVDIAELTPLRHVDMLRDLLIERDVRMNELVVAMVKVNNTQFNVVQEEEKQLDLEIQGGNSRDVDVGVEDEVGIGDEGANDIVITTQVAALVIPLPPQGIADVDTNQAN